MLWGDTDHRAASRERCAGNHTARHAVICCPCRRRGQGRSHGESHQLAFVGDGHGWRPGMDTERKAPSFVIQVTNGTGSVRQFASKAVRCEARAAFEVCGSAAAVWRRWAGAQKCTQIRLRRPEAVTAANATMRARRAVQAASFNLLQLCPFLLFVPALLKLRLGLFQGRHAVRARHRAVDGHRPEPAQILRTASNFIDAADNTRQKEGTCIPY
jgi:hypothetical protein